MSHSRTAGLSTVKLGGTRAATSDALQRTLENDARARTSPAHLIELETKGYTTLKGVLDERKHRTRDVRDPRSRRSTRTGKRIDVATESGDNIAGVSYIPYLLYARPGVRRNPA